MGISIIKIYILGGIHIVGYTFKNHVVKTFLPYVRRYTSPNENFEYSYPLILCQMIKTVFQKQVNRCIGCHYVVTLMRKSYLHVISFFLI